ncbi:MAG TPA: protein kinase [Candidatus Choladousia intestinigallinarum]|nr:protein kinase [Candidatus Choladousia intestinigallinarum]
MKKEIQKICPDCFCQSMEGGVCVRCGYEDVLADPNGQQLPRFFSLAGRYLIGRVLGEGGFGITYKAYDTLNHMICAIKEFVPQGISRRREDGVTLEAVSGGQIEDFDHGKQRFLEEAQVLKKLSVIPEVVQITDYFEENNTVYFVMEYLEGMNLRRTVRAAGGRLAFQEARQIIALVGNALEKVHRQEGIFHRDISPENIMVTRSRRVKIIDFGSAKYITGKKSQNLSVVLKPGFAPPEQYSSTGKQGSYTDVYALAGTFYYTLTGVMVPDAPERLSGERYMPLKETGLGIDPRVSDAVDRALALNYRVRTQTAGEFVRQIYPDSGGGTETTHSLLLAARFGDGTQKSWHLPCGQVVRAGRSDRYADLVIKEDPRISKLHFEIWCLPEKKAIYLKDYSLNGLYYRGRRLVKEAVYQIQDGEFFELGVDICRIRVSIL